MVEKAEIQGKRDQELVELAKADPEYFGYLMERYKGQLFHYIRRISRLSNEDVEDILQEVFVKIYVNLNDYDSDLKFSSWIYRIAHNHVVDNFRKISSRPKIADIGDEDWMRIVGSEGDLLEKIGNKECAQKIRESIMDLPLKYREALILRFLEDKDYDEIMDIMERPKGTVATLLARGRKMLAGDLKKRGINCK